MSNILVINSSASGDASVSRHLVDEAVAKLRAADPAAQVVFRDVGENPVPHLTADSVAALRRGESANDAQREAVELSDALIAEITQADTIVIGAPMYNFGMASTLKAWFDYVLRAGRTFRYTEAGPEGLLQGKRAIVVLSRGGLYSSGPAKVMDSQEPHLRGLLGFVGVTDVSIVYAEKLAFGPEDRDLAVAEAQTTLGTLVDEHFQQAA